MKLSKFFKLGLAAGILLATLLIITLIFLATNAALNVWEQMHSLPSWLFYFYSLGIGIIFSAGLWIASKLFLFKQANTKNQHQLSEESLIKEIDTIEESGIDTQELRQELLELNQRRDTGKVHIALFGDVSTGKSSIIKALLPNVEIETDIRGGSTTEIARYTWVSPSQDQLILTDLPGRNEESGKLDELSQEEAIRAQVVIYVADSDLTRTMFNDLRELQRFNKPLILAINKSDRFSDEEQTLIRQRISEHFSAEKENRPSIVFITSGGEEEVIRIYPDGREEKIIRPRVAKIEPLAMQLQEAIDNQGDTLESLRDASVFVLIKQKLDDKKIVYLRTQADELINSYTKKAVLGGMAAVSPGADLVIQGVLGTLMVKKICKLYEAPVRSLDIDNFLKFSQGHMKNNVPLVLAVAGNGLKAFPGIGTIAGGLVHAVAYGMIFDALGRAVVATIESRGALKAAPASLTFKEMLGDNLENRAKLFARLVLDSRKSNKISKD